MDRMTKPLRYILETAFGMYYVYDTVEKEYCVKPNGKVGGWVSKRSATNFMNRHEKLWQAS